MPQRPFIPEKYTNPCCKILKLLITEKVVIISMLKFLFYHVRCEVHSTERDRTGYPSVLTAQILLPDCLTWTNCFHVFLARNDHTLTFAFGATPPPTLGGGSHSEAKSMVLNFIHVRSVKVALLFITIYNKRFHSSTFILRNSTIKQLETTAFIFNISCL